MESTVEDRNINKARTIYRKVEITQQDINNAKKFAFAMFKKIMKQSPSLEIKEIAYEISSTALVKAYNNYNPDHEKETTFQSMYLSYVRWQVYAFFRKMKAAKYKGWDYLIIRGEDIFEGYDITDVLPSDHYGEQRNVFDDIDAIIDTNGLLNYLEEDVAGYFQMHYYEEMSFADIATKINVSRQRIDQIIKRDLKRLFKLLKTGKLPELGRGGPKKKKTVNV